ncbi:hypothetical protein [Longicatena caecimuris]|uniref:Lipoprotein n=1 Tax=Longicatena caecimuris TaxID=1796635 RepID=A0A4R3TKW2_9FIRM|nr:hypothetical protein [Longicatena caecimuris]MCR1869287.1 hypothetical protein [Longicatena caecimuris]MCU0101791.1 hypothetical protein [Longicatena caecimuris]TCU63018.1 hypothetical protein EDD61_10217 [Longicatena caecimuris]
MKRFRIIMLSVVLCVIFTGCKGTISNDVEIDYGVSTKYSRLELEKAVNVIKKDFVRSFEDCTMERLVYAGDKQSKEHGEYYTKADTLLFFMDYKTGNFSSDTLNKNSEYPEWQIMLVKDASGVWKIYPSGCGYG